MGAIVNGLNLHYFRAFGSTFLQFYDYMKNTVRLAALMELPSLFVYTHDSIGLGEDGPTHQPIEHLAAMRAVPRLYTLRPADANETALCWQFALSQTEHPCTFALSRQGLPVLDPDIVPADAVDRGAYVLYEASRRAGGGADRHRLRGRPVRLGARAARGRRHPHARRERALRGALPRAGRRLPAVSAPARPASARGRRGRPPPRLGPLRGRSGLDYRNDHLWRLGAR